MKKIIPASLIALAAATAFVFNHQPAQAHGRYHHYYYNHYYPYYPFSAGFCYPVTEWYVNQDPGYHPHAYSDGYRKGQKSAEQGEEYKRRTAGGEFARGFDDGYYGREFKGQKHIVANTYRPYTTSGCNDWF